MSESHWRYKLRQMNPQRRSLTNPSRVAVVGIGHELRGDDAAGIRVAQSLQSTEHTFVIDAGAAPENFTGSLCAFQPEWVLFVDAVQMDRPPGTIAWVDSACITGISASTHTLPLDILAQYLTNEIGCEVTLIGIQPEQTAFGDDLSPSVQQAVDMLVQELDEWTRWKEGV